MTSRVLLLFSVLFFQVQNLQAQNCTLNSLFEEQGSDCKKLVFDDLILHLSKGIKKILEGIRHPTAGAFGVGNVFWRGNSTLSEMDLKDHADLVHDSILLLSGTPLGNYLRTLRYLAKLPPIWNAESKKLQKLRSQDQPHIILWGGVFFARHLEIIFRYQKKYSTAGIVLSAVVFQETADLIESIYYSDEEVDEVLLMVRVTESLSYILVHAGQCYTMYKNELSILGWIVASEYLLNFFWKYFGGLHLKGG